jgi:hypothetical protein
MGGLTIIGTTLLIIAALMGPPGQPGQIAEAPRRVCPPVVSVPPRAMGFPVDDVLGVRAGMNERDVTETIKCASEAYEIETIAVKTGLRAPKTRPLLRVARGEDTLSFALFGPVGQERVAAMWREAYYDVGVGPPMASIEGALIAQYGAAHEERESPEGGRILMWTYAPDGRPIRLRPKSGDIAANISYMAAGWTAAACIKNIKSDPMAAPAWDGRCGLTIRAEITPNLADKTHTARWRVAVLDQATLARNAAQLRALGAATPP